MFLIINGCCNESNEPVNKWCGSIQWAYLRFVYVSKMAECLQKWQRSWKWLYGCIVTFNKLSFFTKHILELHSHIAHKLTSRHVVFTSVAKTLYFFRVKQSHVLLENTLSLKYSNILTCTMVLCSALNILKSVMFRIEKTCVSGVRIYNILCNSYSRTLSV